MGRSIGAARSLDFWRIVHALASCAWQEGVMPIAFQRAPWSTLSP
jgi:hypothetical protein